MAIVLLIALTMSDSLRDCLALIGNAPTATGLQRVSTVLGLAPPPNKPVTIIDIDEESWSSWGRPLLTPREKLAAIIDRLAPLRPEAIMIDIDVSRPEAGDSALRMAITNATDSIRILLPRDISKSGLETTMQPTGFDDLVSINWVSVRFLTDDANVVTHWRPWEPICRPKPATALPSPQLYLTLFNKNEPTTGERQRAYQRAAEAFCANKKAVVDETLSSKPSRMVYAFGDMSSSILTSEAIRQNGATAPALFRVTATTALEKKIAPNLIRNRIVIVGASHADSRDIYMTPYGAMPGMMIVANAIAMGPAIMRPSLGSVATTIGSLALAVASAAIYLQFRFVFFFFLSSILSIGLYAIVASFYQPSGAADIVTGALAMLAALLGFESLWQTAIAWRRGCGFSSIFKGREI